MKQLFVFFGAACALVGAGLAVPRPALAQAVLECTLVQGTGASGTSSIWQIDEPVEAQGSTEANSCFIPNNSFAPFGTVPIDILEPGHFTRDSNGQPVPTPGDQFPVSDHAQFTFPVPSGPCAPACTVITLSSDPGPAGGTETGLPLTTGSVLFYEDAQGVAVDPNDPTGRPCGTSADNTTACLIIQSDAEASGQVPEPSTGLLLGAVLPGLFGFRRLSRRDL